MAESDDLANRVQLLYEAIISEASFKAAEERARASATKVAQDTLKIAVDAENKRRQEAARIQGAQTKDEQQELRGRIALENRQRTEAKAIMDAMQKDHQSFLKNKLDQDKRYFEDRRKFDQANRQSQLYTPAQMNKFKSEADKLLEMLGGGPGGPGGSRRGAAAGTARQTNPFLTSLGFAISSSGLPGSRYVGGAAIGGGFGGSSGAAGAIAGGVAIGGILVAIKTIKDNLENTDAETKFAGAIQQVGASYDKSRQAAEAFRSTLQVSRAESLAVATAFAAASNRVDTRPGDISNIGARATAIGQSPEELARTIDAISRGNKDVFETQTGLRANIVINEYARSIGKLPAELGKAREAQALYNKFVEQGAQFQELAGKRLESTGAKWEKFKNTVGDLSIDFGGGLLDALRGETTGSVYRRDAASADAESIEWNKRIKEGKNPINTALIEEQMRQRKLDERIESVAAQSEVKYKAFQVEKVGETRSDRLKSLQNLRDEINGLVGDLDQADPRLKKTADTLESEFSKAFSGAHAEVEALRKSLVGMVGEISNYALPGQNNPFVKIYSDSEVAADQAAERFRLFGDDVVSTFTRMQMAQRDAQLGQLQVTSTMKAMSLEFEASRLSKPFIELTGEMKRTLSVLQSEVSVAINVPKLLASATAIDLYSRYRTPQSNERAFGLFGVSETSGTFVAQQQFDRLRRLRTQYGGEGRGGAEANHIIDQELIKLFQSMPPGLQGAALRAQGGQYAKTFGGAYRSEADYSEAQVTLALQRAAVGRDVVSEATTKYRELERLRSDPKANTTALRAEVLALTGAIPREELTPELLKGRVAALKEEAVMQRNAQQAAIDAVKEAVALRKMLEGRLGELKTSLKNREESVLLRVIDDSTQARVSTLGPAIGQ